MLSTPDGCWSGTVLAADGRAATWHRPGRRFGRDLPGFPADQRQRLGASLEAAAAAADRPEARPEEVTIWRVDPALGQRWFRCVHRARRDPDRGVVVEGLAIDVTDLKRAEAAAARARALEEENRRLAEDRAAAADRLARQRSEILAVMAHEIRTPLTGLLGFAELLAEAGLPAGPHRHAAQALQGGRDLLAIVNDILHLAKLEAGKGTMSRSCPSTPPPSCARRWRCAGRRRRGQGLALTLELAPDLPGWVAGDPTRLRQVMLNLLSESAVSTPIRGEVASAPGRWRRTGCGWRCQDSGIGIAPGRAAAPSSPCSSRPSLAPRGASAAPGWAWRSAAGWSRRWAGRSAPRACRARAACSGSRCRCPRPRPRTGGGGPGAARTGDAARYPGGGRRGAEPRADPRLPGRRPGTARRWRRTAPRRWRWWRSAAST